MGIPCPLFGYGREDGMGRAYAPPDVAVVLVDLAVAQAALREAVDKYHSEHLHLGDADDCDHALCREWMAVADRSWRRLTFFETELKT